MKKSNSTVAVIGLGNIGKVVATNLVKGNRTVILADKTIDKATALATSLGTLASAAEIGDAIKAADIVVLSVYFASIKEIFEQYATELQGKIIIDPSNPIAPDENGGFKKIIGENESSGQILSTLLPKNAKLAKALGTLGAASLEQAAFNNPLKVQFYATDDNSINDELESLIYANGFEPVKIGGLDQSIKIEVFGDLHEFGALGKPVTLEEAHLNN
jgi:predicted dinucleotide-binding enzyme